MADSTSYVVTSTEIAHIGSGASIASGGLSVTSDVSTALVGTGNLAKYPRCDLVLNVIPTATTSLTSMNILCYRRDINVGSSTGDDGVPGVSNKKKYVGAFQVTATAASTTSFATLVDIPLPSPFDCEFYIENGLSGNIPAGWTLKVIPKTDAGTV